MTKTKRVCSYALMLAALGLGSRPLQAEAKECTVDRIGAYDAEIEMLLQGDSLNIGCAVTNDRMQEILGRIPQETKLAGLTFYVEPLEDIHITDGTFDEIVLSYVSEEKDADHAPAVFVEQNTSVERVQVIGGNARIATREPLKMLSLGETHGQRGERISEDEILQHVQIGTDVQTLSVLRKTTEQDYIYGPESVRLAEDYVDYTGDCVLEPGYSVGSIDLYEYYYDGVLEKDVILCKESAPVDRMPYGMQQAESVLFQNGEWNLSHFQLEKRADWQENYARLVLYTGQVKVSGNVSELVIRDRTRFQPGAGSLKVLVNGDVSKLVLLGDCVDTELIVNGSIGSGRKSSCVRGPDELGYVYFSVAKENSGVIWSQGMPGEGIYFYGDETCSGAGYRISGSPQQNAARFGVDQRTQRSYYNRVAFDNLGLDFSMIALGEEEQRNIGRELRGKTHEILEYAGLAFEICPMSYYETEDGLYSTDTAGTQLTMASEPVEFRLRLPEDWLWNENRLMEENSEVQYYIVRLHCNPQTGRMEYHLLECVQEGDFLQFRTDRFSTFAVIRGTMAIPEIILEETEAAQEQPEQIAEELPARIPNVEPESSNVQTYAPDTGDDTPDVCGLFVLFWGGMFIIGIGYGRIKPEKKIQIHTFLKSGLERDKLRKTMIFFKGVYDTLDLFTDSLIKAFSQMGMETFVYQAAEQKKSKEDLLNLLERSDDAAVVTFNNLGYNLDLADGRNIWEIYDVPYIDILMDHPFHYGKPLAHMPETAVILCTDRNHVAYIRRFFPNIRKCGFLPHAGVEYAPQGGTLETRNISVLYAGALPIYTVSRMIPDLRSIPEVDGEDMAETVLAELVHHPYKTTEQAIEEYVRSVRNDISDERLQELIVTMRFLDSYATSFFREQAVRSLVENGISVTAYGVGWDQCEWSNHPNLIYGGKVPAPQILPLMNDSKIVLNTLTWFKAGAHDRIFNGMLARAAVVTDDSTYLNEIFSDGNQLFMFRLENIRELPEKVHDLLAHPKQLQELADCGYEAARAGHTWKNRAQEICAMME